MYDKRADAYGLTSEYCLIVVNDLFHFVCFANASAKLNKFVTNMIDELKKSLSAILYERTTSPFYGTLLISWLIWNWKIVYLTLFISENKINTDKINYITNNFNDIHCLLIYPLISTVVLLTVIPYISNGAYWLSLKFNKWKKDQKNVVEMATDAAISFAVNSPTVTSLVNTSTKPFNLIRFL